MWRVVVSGGIWRFIWTRGARGRLDTTRCRGLHKFRRLRVRRRPATRQKRICAKAQRHVKQKLKTTGREAERANRRLDALKQGHQRLAQLSYQDLVDTEV